MQDGYIKYKSHWKKESIELDPYIIAEISKWRSRFYAKEWIGMYSNGIGFGNISMKLEEDSFLISGSATGGKSDTNIGDFAIVHNYDLSQNTLSCSGEVIASSEAMSHAALYKNGTSHIVHIHNLFLWKKHLNVLPTISSEIEYGTVEMAMALSACKEKIAADYGIIIMGGHKEGIIAYGTSFEHLFNLFQSL